MCEARGCERRGARRRCQNVTNQIRAKHGNERDSEIGEMENARSGNRPARVARPYYLAVFDPSGRASLEGEATCTWVPQRHDDGTPLYAMASRKTITIFAVAPNNPCCSSLELDRPHIKQSADAGGRLELPNGIGRSKADRGRPSRNDPQAESHRGGTRKFSRPLAGHSHPRLASCAAMRPERRPGRCIQTSPYRSSLNQAWLCDWASRPWLTVFSLDMAPRHGLGLVGLPSASPSCPY